MTAVNRADAASRWEYGVGWFRVLPPPPPSRPDRSLGFSKFTRRLIRKIQCRANGGIWIAAIRYQLSDVQWTRLCRCCPATAGDPGRTGSGSQLFVNGRLWVLRWSAHWGDLSERYVKWKTVRKRFGRCYHADIREQVFEALTTDCYNHHLVIYSTIVRPHQHAATGKGAKDQGWGVPDESRALREPIAARGAQAVIASNRSPKVVAPHDACAYKDRNRIERCFNRISTSADPRRAATAVLLASTASSNSSQQ